jgi:16S rRNA (uracil1498-N3)-methyltransferase
MNQIIKIQQPLLENKMSNRVYIQAPLLENQLLTLSQEDMHYLINVLRLGNLGKIRVFNERNGEYQAQIKQIAKKEYAVEIQEKIKDVVKQRPIKLAVSLIKNDRFLLALEKVTELGVTEIQPVICERSQYNKLNMERTSKCLKEATEQSERFEIPTLKTAVTLRELITSSCYDEIIVCSEKADQNHNLLGIQENLSKNICFVVGPEGGFTKQEFDLMSRCKHISLGNNILRAETAAIVLVSQIQFLYHTLGLQW